MWTPQVTESVRRKLLFLKDHGLDAFRSPSWKKAKITDDMSFERFLNRVILHVIEQSPEYSYPGKSVKVEGIEKLSRDVTVRPDPVSLTHSI